MQVAVVQLSPEELLLQYGLVFGSDKVGLYQAETGILHATTAVSMFQSLARKYGATLRDHSKVEGWTSTLVDGVRREEILLADGECV